MAVLRMTAIALVACNAASADPPRRDPSGHPAGWKQLPAIANAVGAAARAEGVVIDAADAWGQPAIGCYAVRLALHGPEGDATLLATQILDGIARVSDKPREPAIAITDVTMPGGPQGVLAFTFARPPYRGRARAQLGGGRIAMAVCFANQREPGACDAPCASVLQGVP
jgi:hypothetical protein